MSSALLCQQPVAASLPRLWKGRFQLWVCMFWSLAYLSEPKRNLPTSIKFLVVRFVLRSKPQEPEKYP